MTSDMRNMRRSTCTWVLFVLSHLAGSALRKSFSTRSMLLSCAPIPSRRPRTTTSCSYKFISLSPPGYGQGSPRSYGNIEHQSRQIEVHSSESDASSSRGEPQKKVHP